ncbi:hypothetical protein E2C01_052657 [Portunus trituberculatus]|uniref:Uncharacterized protein n=1 Tax=Portunus trituberculatus TaxID=210409 RepID=A0A5B7GM36_PORTR|nr:hypothetical protein [Portunus trituberculatus]
MRGAHPARFARHRLGPRDERLYWASPYTDVTSSIMATTCRISQLPPLSHTNHSATVIIITCKAPPRPRTGGLGSHRRPYASPSSLRTQNGRAFEKNSWMRVRASSSGPLMCGIPPSSLPRDTRHEGGGYGAPMTNISPAIRH